MQRSAALSVLASFLMFFSGCVGSAQASAMDGQGPAESAAETWDGRAALVGIIGVEGTFSWAGMDWTGMGGDYMDDGSDDAFGGTQGAYWDRAKDDDRIGDGRSEVWMYRFLGAERNQALVVIVDRDGNVLHQEVDEREEDDVPLGDWKVDSDEALKIAKGANEGLRRGTQSERFGVVEMLGRDPDDARAKWMVAGGGGDATGGGGGMVEIDAVTGTVLASQGGFGQA